MNVLEAPIFHCVFVKGHNVWENDSYLTSTQKNVVAIYNVHQTRIFGSQRWNVSCIGNNIGHNFKPFDNVSFKLPNFMDRQ